MTLLAIEPGVASEVSLRCPETLHGDADAGKLLGIIRLRGEQPSFVKPDNLIELPCDFCKAQRRRAGQPVRRVLHRFNVLGELVETLVVE